MARPAGSASWAFREDAGDGCASAYNAPLERRSRSRIAATSMPADGGDSRGSTPCPSRPFRLLRGRSGPHCSVMAWPKRPCLCAGSGASRRMHSVRGIAGAAIRKPTRKHETCPYHNAMGGARRLRRGCPVSARRPSSACIDQISGRILPPASDEPSLVFHHRNPPRDSRSRIQRHPCLRTGCLLARASGTPRSYPYAVEHTAFAIFGRPGEEGQNFIQVQGGATDDGSAKLGLPPSPVCCLS